MVPSVVHGYPGQPIGGHRPTRETPVMEVIAPARHDERLPVIPTVGGTVFGTLLIVSGVVLAWAALATPILMAAVPTGHPGPTQVLIGMGIWAVALVAPAALVIAGAARLARILGRTRRAIPKPSPVVRALAGLPEGIVVASGLTMPDGRGISEVVVGPFGAAVIRQLPPREFTRIQDGQWRLHTRRGWIALENPLERASRDAERVRRWFSDDDADFVVKVYAAVVGPDADVARSANCAVLTPEQLVPWITALAPQRTLTEGRRERLFEMVRAAV